MACPVPFFRRIGDQLYKIPCGHCPQCRIDARNNWTLRILQELRDRDGTFVTLTIDDEHMRYPASVYKVTVQRFLKRLRKRLGSRRIKYFFVSEYGDPSNTMRPHYHGILVNVSCGLPMSRDVGDVPMIRASWPYGFIKCEPASRTNIRYVLKYLDKYFDEKTFREQYPKLNPPFRLMSKGLGAEYILDHQEGIIEDNGLWWNGKLVPLPRYYRKKLGFGPVSFSLGESDKKLILDYMEKNKVNLACAMNELGMRNIVDLKAKENVGNIFIKRC